MDIVNQLSSGIVLKISNDFTLDGAIKHTIDELKFDIDPMYGIVQKELMSVFPDFEWHADTWTSHGFNSIVVEFRGTYKTLTHNDFVIYVNVEKYNGTYAKIGGILAQGMHYGVRFRFFRDDKELPSIADKVKVIPDGKGYRGCGYSDDGSRIFLVNQGYENDVPVIRECTKMTEWVKAVCQYRVKLANKYVEADKFKRKETASLQTELDIETMEFPSKMKETADKYYLGKIETLNNNEYRLYTVEFGSAAIGIKCNSEGAQLYLRANNGYNSVPSAYEVPSYLVKLVQKRFEQEEHKFANGSEHKGKFCYAYGDDTIFKVFNAACEAYSKLSIAYSDITDPLRKVFSADE